MPRPTSITVADLARWDALILERAVIDANFRAMLLQAGDSFREDNYAGRWTLEQLAAAGCPQRLATDILGDVANQLCCAEHHHGEPCVHSGTGEPTDVWEVSQAAVDAYRNAGAGFPKTDDDLLSALKASRRQSRRGSPTMRPFQGAGVSARFVRRGRHDA